VPKNIGLQCVGPGMDRMGLEWHTGTSEGIETEVGGGMLPSGDAICGSDSSSCLSFPFKTPSRCFASSIFSFQSRFDIVAAAFGHRERAIGSGSVLVGLGEARWWRLPPNNAIRIVSGAERLQVCIETVSGRNDMAGAEGDDGLSSE